MANSQLFSRESLHRVLSMPLGFYRSSRPEVFCKKGVLRNFTKFTGKHLCQSLFFNKVAGLRLLRLQIYLKSTTGNSQSRNTSNVSNRLQRFSSAISYFDSLPYLLYCLMRRCECQKLSKYPCLVEKVTTNREEWGKN